jgi:hypothetical protein
MSLHFKTYWSVLLFLVFVAAMHALGVYGGLYTYFVWYDIPMHIIGGIWVALSANWFYKQLFPHRTLGFWGWLLLIVGSALFVGVVWEVFETITNTSNPPPGFTYWSDTIKDVCDDLIGSFAVFIPTYLNHFKKHADK